MLVQTEKSVHGYMTCFDIDVLKNCLVIKYWSLDIVFFMFSFVYFLCFISAILTLEQAYSLTSSTFDALKTGLKAKSLQTFEERRAQLQVCVSQTVQEQQTYSIR